VPTRAAERQAETREAPGRAAAFVRSPAGRNATISRKLLVASLGRETERSFALAIGRLVPAVPSFFSGPRLHTVSNMIDMPPPPLLRPALPQHTRLEHSSAYMMYVGHPRNTQGQVHVDVDEIG